MSLDTFIKEAKASEGLSEEQMTQAMRFILDGGAGYAELEEFLVTLSTRGETIDEVVGAAKVLREKAATLSAPYGAIDCCGTGGDKKGTYNISTATAIVAASCGAIVAKHGNRASSSKSGSSDVLETLGVNLDMKHRHLEQALNEIGFAFLMAPHHHKSMIHVGAVRKKIAHRTIFNILGPLANPAGTKRQLIGVYDRSLVLPMAEVCKRLGMKKAWIVHGDDGLDEITTTTTTQCAILDEEGRITEKTLHPEDFGLPQTDESQLLGGSAEENAQALRAILEGRKCGYRDIVIANTAAVLVMHGSSETLIDGAKRAAQALSDGSANRTFKDYVAFSRRVMSEE